MIQKNIYRDNEWTFIGGGREEGESLKENLFKEIEEETELNKNNFELLKISNKKIEYDYPKELAKKVHNSKYRGQSYNQALVKFKGDKKNQDFKLDRE